MSSTYYYSDDEEEYNYEYKEAQSLEENTTKLIQEINHDEGTNYFNIQEVNVYNVMIEYISKIAYTLDISINSATLLLIDYRWNEDKIYQEIGNDSIFLEKYINFKELEYQKINLLKNNFKCTICDNNSSNIVSLSCGHAFCEDCYQQYLEVNVNEGMSVLNLKCPSYKCEHRIIPTYFELYCNKEIFNKYKRFLTKNYMECKKGMQYCRGHCCQSVFIRQDMIHLMGTIEGEVKKCKNTCADIFVECSDCKNRQCFKCNSEEHYPITCEQLVSWLERDRNEGQTMNWIVVNTKKCPNCRNPIEKNQGCRHMKCKNCNHDFCWDCMHKWDTNCGYGKTCNGKVKEGYETENDRKIKNDAATEIHYYLSHYQAYMKQKDAIKFAIKLKDSLNVKIMKWIEVMGNVAETGEFLSESIDTVIWSRNILKNCNIWKFFTTDENRKNLINLYYDDLMNQTEYLTSLTEKSIEELNKIDIVNSNMILRNSIKSINDIFNSFES